MKLDETSSWRAKLVTMVLGYRDPFRLMEDMGLLVENENPHVFQSTRDLGFTEGILRQADALVESECDSRREGNTHTVWGHKC